MNRCKICHAFAMLDTSGRCGSCAKALAATKAGMHYGDYVAGNLGKSTQGATIPPEPDIKTRYCPVCAEPIRAVGGHINRKKYCSESCRRAAEYRRRIKARAQAEIQLAMVTEVNVPKRAEIRKPGTCRYCGKEITRVHMEGRKPSYCDTTCQYMARLARAQEKNAERG